jgi:hypothetical protein
MLDANLLHGAGATVHRIEQAARVSTLRNYRIEQAARLALMPAAQ